MKKNYTSIRNVQFFGLRLTLCLVIIFLSITLSIVNAQAIVNPAANTPYYIKNVSAGLYLTNTETNSAQIQTLVDGNDNQKFYFELVSGTTYKIKNASTSLYMNRPNGWDVNFIASTTNGWILEAYNGKTIIKVSGSQHMGVDNTTNNSAVYYNKAWSTNTKLQWEIIDATVLVKTALQTALDNANTTKNAVVIGSSQGRYSQADYDTFSAAITAAQDVYNTATTQSQIDGAVTTLNTARTAFLATMVQFVPDVNKYYMISYGSSSLMLASRVNSIAEINTGNSEDLLQRIRFEEVPSYPGRYFLRNGNDLYFKQSGSNAYDLTWGTVNDLTYNGNHYTIETVNETDIRIKSVKSAYLGINNAATPAAADGVYADKSSAQVWRCAIAPDLLIKTVLQTAIADANAIKTAAVIGTTQGRYSQADYDTFNAAITTAQGVYDNPTSQLQINTAVTTLNTAVTTFTATMVQFVPVVDKFYYIKYKDVEISMSQGSSSDAIQVRTPNASDQLQRLRFVADDLYPGSYWIFNGNNQALSQIYGNTYSMQWEIPTSGSTWNGYRFYIETINETDIRIKSVKSGLYLGVDETTDGATVYSDKNNSHFWRQNEASDLTTNQDISNSNNYLFYIEGRTIRIPDLNNVFLSVVSIDGKCIYSNSTFSGNYTASLPSGLYIMTINTIKFKVKIK